MTSPLVTSQPSISTTPASCKAVVFAIAGHRFALPIATVLRVINSPQALNTQGGVGLVYLGDQALMVIDLYEPLTARTSSRSYGAVSAATHRGQFLMIVRSQSGEPCGIPIDEPPTLLDLPLSVIRTLPQSYRQSMPLDIASHVAVLSDQGVNVSIFLLSINQVLRQVGNV